MQRDYHEVVKEDLEKYQPDLDLPTTKLLQLLQLQQEQSTLIHTHIPFQNNDKENQDEIKNILELHQSPQHTSPRQSLISTISEEKQQLIAQNERLSLLLAEKERELISFQQAEKTREDLIKNLETLKMNLKQMTLDKEVKQIELTDVRNVLDEQLRENSLLKQEKNNCESLQLLIQEKDEANVECYNALINYEILLYEMLTKLRKRIKTIFTR